MTTKKNILILYLLILIEFLLLIKAKTIKNSIKTTSITFITNVFPFIFLNMIIGNMIIKCNLSLIVPKYIKNIFNKLFNFNESELIIYIMSIICGAPNNAIFINNYYEKGLITSGNKKYLLYITNFINPLFIIGVSLSLFNNIKYGFLIIILNIMLSMIKAFILKKHFINETNKTNNISKINYYEEFNNVIKSSISSILYVFAVIIIFNILTSLINEIFHLKGVVKIIINGLIEMTCGINYLINIKSNIIKFLLAFSFISFNGICIRTQTMGLLKEKK